jgi:hypothetical protein
VLPNLDSNKLKIPVSPNVIPESTVTRLRIALSGLRKEEDLLFSKLLPERLNAVIVQDRTYNVLFVDARNPETERMVRERVKEAVIVITCDPDETEVRGAIALRRPFTPDVVVNVFQDVARSVARLEALFSQSRVKQVAPSSGNPNKNLEDLAVDYRFSLARLQSLTINIEGQQFHLAPHQYLYKSVHSLEGLPAHRGQSLLNIEVVDTSGTEGAFQKAEGTPQRLDLLLWQIGFNAGAGKLIPWLTEARAYRLMRWPPVVRTNNDSTLVRLGTLMARRTLHPSELVRATGIGEEAISDFLNGCSLVGCLEGFKPSEVPAPQVAKSRNPSHAPLLSRIRMRLGLT